MHLVFLASVRSDGLEAHAKPIANAIFIPLAQMVRGFVIVVKAIQLVPDVRNAHLLPGELHLLQVFLLSLMKFLRTAILVYWFII